MKDGRRAWQNGKHPGYVLDVWHLERALQATLGPEHAEIPTMLASAVAGEPDGLLRPVRRLLGRASTADIQAALRRLVEYLQLNAEGIRNLPRAAVWRSGAMEK
jgi:hypothetical protein